MPRHSCHGAPRASGGHGIYISHLFIQEDVVLVEVLTTGKPTFAARQIFCRALYFGRTAKRLVAVRFFIRRTAKKKRTASKLFAVRQKKTHGKDLIYRAFYFLAHDKDFLPTAVSSRQQTSRGEVPSPCVFGMTHGKVFSIYVLLSPNFNSP
jgi:hypothetical protein